MVEINPYDKAHELARAITSSDQYLNYVKAKNVLEANPELKEKVLNLRNKQLELNRAQMLGQEVSQESISQLTVEFAKLNQTKELADFFNAEGAFIQMFSDVQEIIHKAVEERLGE